MPVGLTLKEMERELIRKTLEHTGGNRQDQKAELETPANDPLHHVGQPPCALIRSPSWMPRSTDKASKGQPKRTSPALNKSRGCPRHAPPLTRRRLAEAKDPPHFEGRPLPIRPADRPTERIDSGPRLRLRQDPSSKEARRSRTVHEPFDRNRRSVRTPRRPCIAGFPEGHGAPGWVGDAASVRDSRRAHGRWMSSGSLLDDPSA
jgi:hypothetical protein